MRKIIAVDVGGTNVRFARAQVQARGAPVLTGTVRKYKVADFPSLDACWARFGEDEGTPLPDAAAIGFAAPIRDGAIKLTNSNWIIHPDQLAAQLGVTSLVLVNDFEAVAHAVAHLPAANLPLVFGPDAGFPESGSVTVLGVGTGLGVALILFDKGVPHVIATEGGHGDFAPLDATEDRILAQLRVKFRRVSTERLVSGPGLNTFYQALAQDSGHPVRLMNDADLWRAALEGESGSLARRALDRLCMTYGSVAGDLALIHGAQTVVLAGGLTQRMRDILLTSDFHPRFVAKGRYETMMTNIPVRLAVHDEIGLFGAAAAFGASL
ncbi:glucokinase [Sphingobium subterraneum]|uniref:Glucokinase n=1 Tax=Sphingobium subterraneum TaxID=627688 RepID=A0A841J152_9SPHN|nr:glucokinase [Sphingobium subterraneum]MBB6122405.1 glucokinase [Sphingobium subterraneum]